MQWAAYLKVVTKQRNVVYGRCLLWNQRGFLLDVSCNGYRQQGTEVPNKQVINCKFDINPLCKSIGINTLVLLCYSPPPPLRKFNLILKERKRLIVLIVKCKGRKTFAPGMHISILKERKRLIDKVLADIAAYWPPNNYFSYILKEQVFEKFQLMISSFSQERFQNVLRIFWWGGGGGGNNRKVPIL